MIPLYKPYMPEDLPEIDAILHSGALAYGKWGRMFEQSLKDFIGCKEDVLVVNSFTATIQVVLSTLGIQSGDEIIASPQSCLASTQPLATFGVEVVWADIDPSRGTLCPDSVARKITPRTKVIFHNHHCSYPGHIDEINAIGKKYGIVVIDDCIESFGSKYKNRMLGSLDTDITIFSFQTVRLPNTIDGGGMIFKDRSLYEKAVRVRDLGVDRTTFRDALGEINPKSDVSIHGYGATMNEVSSYIGYCQMRDLPGLLARQREHAAKWEDEITVIPQLRTLDTADIEPCYWVFGILCENKSKALALFREKGYTASGVHVPNTFYSVFDNNGEFPGVKEFYSKFLALPCGWWVEK
ncbi:MAG: aminotransferase class V-fold PLP-dependent enzyme [Prevotellaceae bacterium]|jgi:dTDP-4-amino-4,6-dideoxygalactose transaminase|nr:aminotransferase class V-fold PLP-dependent enzyme [Prevotellaceae bacterium]